MSNFATLDSIKKKNADGSEDGQEYYAGGAGKSGGSGLSVVDPESADDIGKIFAKAHQSGGGDSEGEFVRVTFYKNGFVVGDGPYRPLGDPRNDAFVEEVAKGYCPQELVKNGKPSNVTIVDKRREEYTESAARVPSYTAFAGAGNTLSAAAPGSGVIVPATDGVGPPEVDSSQPTVRVQLRFGDGQRQVAKLNASHTVRDLQRIVEAGDKVSGPYQLLVSIRGPPKPVETADFDKTLKEAGLAGASITVKHC